MAPLPRPLLGLILLANPLLFLLPGPVQGAPLEAHTPTQSWNATGPSNSSRLVSKPARPWSPAPFFWNDAPPRPYHAYGYGGFYHPDKAPDDARGSVNVVDKGSKAKAETKDEHEHEHEHVDDVETMSENGKEDEVDVSSSHAEEPDERNEDEKKDPSSFWNPFTGFTGSRHGDDRKHGDWDWKKQTHGHGRSWGEADR